MGYPFFAIFSFYAILFNLFMLVGRKIQPVQNVPFLGVNFLESTQRFFLSEERWLASTYSAFETNQQQQITCLNTR